MLDTRLLQLPTASQQHHHQHHQVVLGVQGEAELTVDGAGARLDTWKACLVPTDARHDFFGDQQNHVLVINIDPVSPVLSSPAHAHYEKLARLFDKPRALQMDNQMQSFVQFAAAEVNRWPDNTTLHQHLAAGILHGMAERLVTEPIRSWHRPGFNPEDVRSYIVGNLHRKITVADLAGVACLSVSRFHEIFRQVTGTTPHQFLLQTRLDQAVHLLASTKVSVSEVSYRTGFSSQSALTNALRKYRGTTPSKLQAGVAVA